MHYTVDKNPEIDAKIEKDQEYINSQILNLMGNHVHSILLCGGFGRGEGSIEVRGNKIHVINDYDITIVFKERNRFKYLRLYRKYHAPLQALAESLARDLRIKQIDFALKYFAYFEKPTSLKIENLEVKNGHVLTFGSEDPTRLMPDWNAKDIPLFEGTWLFRNRGAGMLIPALYFMRKEGISKEKRENFVIECNKAELAMGDSILLLKRCYHHLYSERLKYIDNIDISDIPDGEKILIHYREALDQKLRPDFQNFYNRDLVEWWFEIVELMNRFYLFYEGKRLNHIFNAWIEYISFAKPEDRFEMMIFFGSLIRKPSALFSKNELLMNYRKANKSFTINIVPLLLFSFRKNLFFSQYMERAASLLGEFLEEYGRDDWLRLVQKFLRIWHPGGEVAKLINLKTGLLIANET